MPQAQHDTSGRAFLLAYIDLLKDENAALQRQLDRYAEDLKSLLTTDAPAALHRCVPLRDLLTAKARRYAPDYIEAVAGLCQRMAERSGQSPHYCAELTIAAREVLDIQQGVKQHNTDANQMALEIALFNRIGANHEGDGADIPLASRIFALAEYTALLTKALYPDLKIEPLQHAELVELLQAGSGRLFDPELVTVLLQLLAEGRQG